MRKLEFPSVVRHTIAWLTVGMIGVIINELCIIKTEKPLLHFLAEIHIPLLETILSVVAIIIILIGPLILREIATTEKTEVSLVHLSNSVSILWSLFMSGKFIHFVITLYITLPHSFSPSTWFIIIGVLYFLFIVLAQKITPQFSATISSFFTK